MGGGRTSFGGNTLSAQRKRENNALCTCGHARNAHFRERSACGLGWVSRNGDRLQTEWRATTSDACYCSRFKKARSATRRSVKKYAGAAELSVANAMGGRRVRNQGTKHGDIDVETETAVIQVKNYAFPNWFRKGLDQVVIGGVGTGKRRLLVVKDKPGPGRKGQTVVCELIEDWCAYNGELPASEIEEADPA